jgi:hypothetical protein
MPLLIALSLQIEESIAKGFLQNNLQFGVLVLEYDGNDYMSDGN